MSANVVAFTCEWFDGVASMVRTFRINHFKDGTLEIINLKNRQTFLKRTYFDDVNRDDFFLGATVTINYRQFFVKDYADEGTKLFYESNNVRVFGLVKPETVASGELGTILRATFHASFHLNRLKMINLSHHDTAQFDCISPGVAVAFEASVLDGDSGSVQSKWDTFVRSFSGKLFGSSSLASAGRLAMSAFETVSMWGGGNDDVTACIIKPHALKEGKLGDILMSIEHDLGLSIEAMEMIHLDRTSASSFFDVYKGVYPHYNDMITHMIEGPSVFIKLGPGLGGQSESTVESFREACGPTEVEVAKILRPKSLRARFGTNRVKNAIHCTDLPSDGSLECNFFRHLLSI